MKEIQLPLPSQLTLKGHEQRGFISVLPAGKPPKLRFRPGTIIRIGSQHYQIVYAYRLQDSPHEWHFCCELRDGVEAPKLDEVMRVVTALGAGTDTPRVVREIFRDGYDVMNFFSDIPMNHDHVTFTNQELLNQATVVSSGEVLRP